MDLYETLAVNVTAFAYGRYDFSLSERLVTSAMPSHELDRRAMPSINRADDHYREHEQQG